MKKISLPQYNPPQFGGPVETPTFPLENNVAIVEHSIFQGKDIGLTIHVHPSNVTKLMPQESGISESDARILAIFSGLKSFARPEYLERANVKTEELAALVDSGYLKPQRGKAPHRLDSPTWNKQGHRVYYDLGGSKITVKGRNALETSGFQTNRFL